MFAVIRTGGKQYRVVKDQVLEVERLDAEDGAAITFDVLMVAGDDGAVTVGAPLVPGATVSAEIVGKDRGPKILIFKKRRRHGYRRKKGHRQDLTVLKITGIGLGA